MVTAPTGRATERLSELTGHEATTLHRLLQLRPGGDVLYDRDNPLDADLIVVDEASMLDVIVTNRVIKAIPPGAHLLLVGDVDQLPSVGAGEVLRDIRDAPNMPRVRLTEVFRQAAKSGVVANAHRVNRGEFPDLRSYPDFYFFACADNETIADQSVDIVSDRIPRRFGLHPVKDTQVVTPMHRSGSGAGLLNEKLQAALIPQHEGSAEWRYGSRIYRVGDKVIQVRNNYQKGRGGVFNRTVGVVSGMDLEHQTLTVVMDEGEEITFEFSELDELMHAYAITGIAPKAASTPQWSCQ